MPGFEFRYRLSGNTPTFEDLALTDGELLSQGDMLAMTDGKVGLAATGDATLVGVAVETLDGSASTRFIRTIVDADAVYGVEDPRIRRKGATLDLAGASGAQTIAASAKADFIVDVGSSAVEETLVRFNEGRHYDKSAPQTSDERPVGGALNAAVARAIVRYNAHQLGRGPTRARAFYHDDIMVVVLEDQLTQAERSLVTGGHADAVKRTRRGLQEIMRPYLTSTVERLTGCTVRAFLSANHFDPDVGAEVFILDRPIAGPPPETSTGTP
jgi:uncharacterized protein YbcI